MHSQARGVGPELIDSGRNRDSDSHSDDIVYTVISDEMARISGLSFNKKDVYLHIC